MRDGGYRDANVGIRARLTELEARIDERESEVTEAFWAALDPPVREHLAVLRAARDRTDEGSLEALTRVEKMLATYAEMLDAHIANLPSVEAAWLEVPDEVADPPIPTLTFLQSLPSDEEAADMLRRFTAMVRERARDAVVVSERKTLLARFRERGCPFALRALPYANGNGQIAEVAMCLVTSIPRALPRLVVRHEPLVLSLGKAFGLRDEVEVGDPSFDGLFAIEGTKAAAERFLPHTVQTHLLTLSHFDVPTFEVDPAARIASVRWRFEPAPRALDAAVHVLITARETPPRLQFRKGPET